MSYITMSTDIMPMLFAGHGNPMNAIQQNVFTDGFSETARTLPKPSAILSVSAHWETRGTRVTAMEKPPTLHDFGGFPRELFKVIYPAPGNTLLAGEVKELLNPAIVSPDYSWGLDHGTWSVLKHMYPDADIPVIQLSLDYGLGPDGHFELAKQLSALRKKGVLIIGSGNIVHNLGMIDWRNIDSEYGYDWAEEVNEKTKDLIIKGDSKILVNYRELGSAFKMAIPTPEHFIPLLYILALRRDEEQVTFFNDKSVAGSLSMTSVKIG